MKHYKQDICEFVDCYHLSFCWGYYRLLTDMIEYSWLIKLTNNVKLSNTLYKTNSNHIYKRYRIFSK